MGGVLAKKGVSVKEGELRKVLRGGLKRAGISLRDLERRPWAPRRQTISGWATDKPLDQLIFVVGLAEEVPDFRESFMTLLDRDHSERLKRLRELEEANRDLREQVQALEAIARLFENEVDRRFQAGKQRANARLSQGVAFHRRLLEESSADDPEALESFMLRMAERRVAEREKEEGPMNERMRKAAVKAEVRELKVRVEKAKVHRRRVVRGDLSQEKDLLAFERLMVAMMEAAGQP
jgi:hypothetical protein